jgi:hypothetical protein
MKTAGRSTVVGMPFSLMYSSSTPFSSKWRTPGSDTLITIVQPLSRAVAVRGYPGKICVRAQHRLLHLFIGRRGRGAIA